MLALPSVLTRVLVGVVRVVMQNPDELFEVVAQTLMASTDRDCLSGWGAIVHVM